MKIETVLIHPVLTEKATNLVKDNVYTFIVSEKANKFQIKEAVEKLYKVKVSAIKSVTRKGKQKKVGRRMITKQLSDKKIVYIKLAEGKIDIFPQT
jgi:large subunit ribosomal protein L23